MGGVQRGIHQREDADPRARSAALRAVQLDSASAEGHASLATYLAWFAHDWAGSEAEYRRAIEINPNYAFAHDQFGLVLAILGRFDEAIAEGKKAMTLDPLSPAILVDAMVAYEYQHNAPVFAELARRATELDPTFYLASHIEGELDLQVGRYRDAIPHLEKARTLDAPSFTTAYLAYAYGKAGDQARARSALADLKRMSRSGEGAVRPRALLSRSGQHEARHRLSGEGVRCRFAVAGLAQAGRHLRPSARDPRFIALMRQMHFIS